MLALTSGWKKICQRTTRKLRRTQHHRHTSYTPSRPRLSNIKPHLFDLAGRSPIQNDVEQAGGCRQTCGVLGEAIDVEVGGKEKDGSEG